MPDEFEFLDPGQDMPINELYAFIVINDEGNEGVVSYGTTPLIFGYPRVVEILRPIIQQMATKVEKNIRLVKFTNREVLETIKPEPVR